MMNNLQDEFLINIQSSVESIKENEIEKYKHERISENKKENYKLNSNKKNNTNLKGGYRPVLVNDLTCLKEESIYLERKFQQYFSQINMNEKDMVSFYLLNYLEKRFPNQLFQNKCQIITDETIIENIQSLSYSNLIDFKNKSVLRRLKSLTNIKTLFDLVNTFNLNSVPYSARFVLVNWYLNDKIKLNLFINKIPTSLDVLSMQSKGERCISLIYENMDKLVLNERDALSFLLHDLVHAYKMFSNDYLLKGQIGFSKCMLKLFNNQNGFDKLNYLIQIDETFSNDFDYLISDMNSHPKHLFHYFKAILINSFKRMFQLDANSHLDGESLEKFNEFFELFLSLFEMNENEKQLCRLILNEKNSVENENVQPFNLVDFTLLDDYFLRLASKINI